MSAALLNENLKKLRDLAIMEHYYCDNPFYSCPKADGECYNDAVGDECNCGADKHNAEVERVFGELDKHNAEVERVFGELSALTNKATQELNQYVGGDEEIGHIKADEILCDFVSTIGFTQVAEAYNKRKKWYS